MMETQAIEAKDIRSREYETSAWAEFASFDRESDTPLAFPYKKLLLRSNYEIRFDKKQPDCMRNGFRKNNQRTLLGMHLTVQSE